MALRTPLTAQPHLYIGDSTGRPLDYGRVYFGEPNKDPEFYPIDIYLDPEMTIAAAQPVRTKGGFMDVGGNLAELHAAEVVYSLKVLDQYGRQVFYKPEMYRNNVSDFLVDEITRATAAETLIAGNLTAETQRAVAAEKVIADAVVTEKDRAVAAEDALDSKYATLDNTVAGIVNGRPTTAFATKALMTASALVDGDYAMVTDDTVNNGLYVKTAGTWVKSGYDPAALAQTYTDNKVKGVTNNFKTKALMTASTLPNDSYAMVTEDTEANNGRYSKVAGAWVKSAYDPLAMAKKYTDIKSLDVAKKSLDIDSGTIIYRSDAFTEESYNSLYSQTKPIPTMGLTKIYVKTHVRLRNSPDVWGLTIDGEIVEISTPYTGKYRSTIFAIPSDVVSVIVVSLNNTSPDYSKDLAEVVVLGNNEEDINQTLIREFKKTRYEGFPVKDTHPLYSVKTHDSTVAIPVIKGMTVKMNLPSSGSFAMIFGGDNVNIIILEAGTKSVKILNNGFITLATPNSTHPDYDPNFVASYEIIYNEVLSSSTTAQNYIAGSYLSTPTLKTVREVTFLDGTDKTAIQYLWYDADWNYYISSSVRGQKTFIFNWNVEDFNNEPPHSYSMGFDAFGNIVCVYRTEIIGTRTNDDSLRKNPIIILKNQNYKAVTVDFGEAKKPSGWLQNCGFLCTDDAIYLTEYTRPSVATANTWKATYPLTDAANWQTVQSFTLSPELNPADNLKHIHNVDRDPFTGFIYTTTGDNNAGAAMYVTKDKAATFTKILDGSEKYCRVLNFIFTKDWVYWATDSTGADHWFFKAPRAADGVIDVANITDVVLFPSDSAATYATIYLKKIQALVFLGRQDKLRGSVPVDLWDLKNNVMVRLDVIPSVAGLSKPLGFRCETFEYYPKGNEIPCGFSVDFGQGGYENHLGILGNTANADYKVGNVVLTIERLNDTFSVSYDTIV